MMRSVVMLASVLLLGFSPQQSIAQSTEAAAKTELSVPQPLLGPVSAVLLNGIDVRRVKVGDLVKVRIYSGISLPSGLRVPPGSMMTGHITEASKLGKGSIESRLGIIFDQAQLTEGKTLPLRMGIAGLAAAPPVNGLDDPSEMSANLDSQFSGARSTGVTVDPGGQKSTANTIGGTGGTRVTRTLPGRTTGSQNTGPNDSGSARSGNHIGAMASVGSTVPGISLRPSLSAVSMLVSTSDNIALRAGTSLVLLPIQSPKP